MLVVAIASFCSTTLAAGDSRSAMLLVASPMYSELFASAAANEHDTTPAILRAVPDVWDLVRDLKEGRRASLLEALSNGFDPNTACKHTGMTVLLGACEANDLEAVQLLLDAGADPNQQHSDGYDSYHSTSSRPVRELLLQRGFSLLIDAPTIARGLQSRRVFAPRAITNAWSGTMDGPTVIVEYCRSTFPPSSGDVIVRIGLDVRFVVPGDHVRLPSAAGSIEAVVDLVDFVGEFQLRLWDEQTIASHGGNRAFYLPPWTAL